MIAFLMWVVGTLGKCSICNKNLLTQTPIHHTTDRDGLTELNPTPARMRAILRSLADTDSDESAPDVWLTHLETGWTLAVFPSGLLQLEADSPKEPLREMHSDFDTVLDLWTILAAGEIPRLLKANWRTVVPE